MSKKRTARNILTCILALVVLAAFPIAAYATDISVSAGSTSVKVGDNVTVTIVITAPHIAVADGVFTYDPSLLSYISSNGGASDGHINLVSLQSGGSSSLTALIKFAAIGDGEAIINVSMENILDYDGQAIAGAQANVKITIAPSGTATPGEPTGETPPAIDMSKTGIATHNVLGTQEQMYIWPSLRNVSLPSGFTDRQVTYNGEFVGGAGIPDNEDLILLYLSQQNGEKAGYYIYDAQKDILFPYLVVSSISAKFTLIWPDESVSIPSGYEPTTLLVKENEMLAWKRPGFDETLYLVYARTIKGEIGFFLYNTADESLQRFSAVYSFAPTPTATPSPTPQPTQQPTPTAQPTKDVLQQGRIAINQTILIAIIAAGGLFAVIAVIFMLLFIRSASRHKKEKDKGIHIKQADL